MLDGSHLVPAHLEQVLNQTVNGEEVLRLGH